MATVTSGTTADLTWTTGGAANAEVVVQPEGTGVPAVADNTGEAASGNTYAAIGLDPATDYEFYVRDECTDGTEFSEWSGPYVFNTTIVPGCSTTIVPVDGAVDVAVGDITFEWTAPTTGDPATSYDMYYGLTPDDVNEFIGNFEDTTALITITGYDAVFYWRIVPVNAGGEATACDDTIWSFTTEAAPAPPANDECLTAIELTPAVDFETSAILATNAGATYTDGTVPDCQDDIDANVWFTVVVPQDGNITLETQTAPGTTLFDTVIEAYTGACGALVPVDCDDDGGPDGPNTLFSILDLTGLTPGSTLTVAVYRYGSSDGIAGDFRIGAYNATLAAKSFKGGTFAAYPNPVKDVLNLSYTKQINDVVVYNMIGQQVFAQTVNVKDAQINLSALNTGSYIVKVTSDNEVQTLKVLKQ
jgi:hypothetical protein